MMLDIKLFRETPELVREGLARRQMDAAVVDEVVALDERRRRLILDVEAKKAERNAVSKEIGRMKSKEEREAKISAMRLLGDEISALDESLKQTESNLYDVMAGIPGGKTKNDIGLVRLKSRLPEDLLVRGEYAGVEVEQLFVGIHPLLLLPQVG